MHRWQSVNGYFGRYTGFAALSLHKRAKSSLARPRVDIEGRGRVRILLRLITDDAARESRVSPIAFAALLGLSLVTEDYLGVHVIHDALPLDEPGRYESTRTYDDTLQYYKWHFKSRGGVRWRNVVNLPHIRAKHIQSVRPRTQWQGINVYELNGRVRIFIVPRNPVRKPPKK